MFVLPIGEYMSQSKIVGALDGNHGGADVFSKIDTRAPGYVTLVRGALSTAALRHLVQRCGITHRELLQFNFHSSAVFPLGTLPSRPKPFVTIRFITIGSFVQGEAVPINDAVRSRIAEQLSDHQKACVNGDRDGFECFRAINFHYQSFFTVEQQATLFTYPTIRSGPDTGPGGLWSGVLLSDVGNISGMAPWNTPRREFEDAQFLSVGSSDLGSARSATRTAAGSPTSVADDISSFLPRPNPFASRVLDDTAMSLDDQQQCARDPFFFAADLFETSALGWGQALNFLHDAFQHLPEEAAARVRVLKETKGLVDRATRYFDETLRFIDARDEMGWHESTSHARSNEIAARLKGDFTALRSAAAELSVLCKETVNITMNEVSVQAAQQGLVENKRLKVVTYLAFFFIPISLLSSMFGMNVAELEDPPSISLFWYIFAGIAPVSVAVPIWLGYRERVSWKQFVQGIRGLWSGILAWLSAWVSKR